MTNQTQYETSNNFERLFKQSSHLTLKYEKLRKLKQQQILEDELKQCTFHPQTNQCAEHVLQGKFLDRTQSWLQKKLKSIETQRKNKEQKQQQQINKFLFKPMIKPYKKSSKKVKKHEKKSASYSSLFEKKKKLDPSIHQIKKEQFDQSQEMFHENNQRIPKQNYQQAKYHQQVDGKQLKVRQTQQQKKHQSQQISQIGGIFREEQLIKQTLRKQIIEQVKETGSEEQQQHDRQSVKQQQQFPDELKQRKLSDQKDQKEGLENAIEEQFLIQKHTQSEQNKQFEDQHLTNPQENERMLQEVLKDQQIFQQQQQLNQHQTQPTFIITQAQAPVN